MTRKATSAPVEPVIASPFAALGVIGLTASGKVDPRPAPIVAAFTAAPDGKRQQWAREAARVHSVPGYSCTVDVTLNTVKGPVTIAAHGFASARDAGIPCPTNGCNGTIRA